MRVGLVGIDGEPIYIRVIDDWAERLLDVDNMEPIVRFQPITVELDPLAETEELLLVINDLARDLVSQGGVEDW